MAWDSKIRSVKCRTLNLSGQRFHPSGPPYLPAGCDIGARGKQVRICLCRLAGRQITLREYSRLEISRTGHAQKEWMEDKVEVSWTAIRETLRVNRM